MSLNLLFPNFEDVIRTPADVEKLNQTILDLAVRGRLVEQDMADEPVEKQLERIWIEKERNAPDSVSHASGIKTIDDSSLPLLPNSWAWVRLGDVVTLRNGRAYKRDELLDDGTPVIRIQNLNGGNQWYYSNLDLPPEKYCNSGDLLYAWSGTFGPYIWNGGRAIYHYHIWRIDLYAEVNRDFIYHALASVTNAIKADSHGVMLLHMTKAKMEGWAIPLPPFAEQHRIVAKVDELFTQTSALAAKLEQAQAQQRIVVAAALNRLDSAEDRPALQPAWATVRDAFDDLYTGPENIAALRQSILDLAVRGRLVEQDPEDEPVSSLLHQIVERRETFTTETKRDTVGSQANASIDYSVPYSLPRSWKWVRFGEITFSRDAERIPLSREVREGRQGEYDYYGASGVIDHIDGYLFDKPLLLIGEDGANLLIRSKPIAFIAKGKYWVNNHAHVIDTVEFDMLRYIELYMNAINLAPYVTGTAQPKMNQTKMNSILVALPPLAEQRRIVAKVDELMRLCDALEAKLVSGETVRSQLTNAILAGVVA